jgi:outer membrane protein, heavy metal efflux system
VAAARAAAEEQRANMELLRRTAAQEVETAYANWVAARRQAERLGGPQLERARRLRELAELGYREGQFSYLELLDAQRAYLTTFSHYLRAVAAANTAEAALERAVGGSLPSGPP